MNKYIMIPVFLPFVMVQLASCLNENHILDVLSSKYGEPCTSIGVQRRSNETIPMELPHERDYPIFFPMVAQIYVSPSGSDSVSCGSFASPCQTIQYAGTRLPPVSGEILLDSGFYNESVVFGNVLSGYYLKIAAVASGVHWAAANIGSSLALVASNISLSLNGIYFENPVQYLTSGSNANYTLAVYNCRFENIISDAVNESALMVSLASNVSINNCAFWNNVGAGCGAALRVTHSKLVGVEGCHFIGNEVRAPNTLSKALGGALCLINVQIANISNSTFINNSALGAEAGETNYCSGISAGGAIYMGDVYESVITYTDFVNNTAKGALCDVSNLESNHGGFAYGGAVMLAPSSNSSRIVMKFNAVNGAENTAIGGAGSVSGGLARGGFLSVLSIQRTSSYLLLLLNFTTLVGNAARGGICSFQQKGYTQGLGGEALGGGVHIEHEPGYMIGSSLEVYSSKFLSNVAEAGCSSLLNTAQGGAIAGQRIFNVSIFGSYFASNVARVGLHCNFSSREYSSGSASMNGGGVSTNAFFFHVEDSTFLKNAVVSHIIPFSSVNFGGAIAVWDIHLHHVQLIDVHFISNSVVNAGGSAGGGAISLRAGNTERVSIEKCVFVHNIVSSSNSRAGGIEFSWMVPSLATDNRYIMNCTFVNNSAVAYIVDSGHGVGGALFLDVGVGAYFDGSVFNSCYAADYGGAVFGFSMNRTSRVFEKNLFLGNSAGIGGGAVAVSWRVVDMSMPAGHGGAVLVIENETRFFENHAVERGGAVYFNSEQPLRWSTAKSVSYVSNSARFGGALFTNAFPEYFTVISSTFYQNSAIEGGGAIWVESLNPIDYCCNSSFFDAAICENNTAAYGVNVSAPITHLQFAQKLPNLVWPSAMISVDIVVIDAFGQKVRVSGMEVSATAIDANDVYFLSGVPGDMSRSDPSGNIRFPRASFAGRIGGNLSIEFIFLNFSLQWDVTLVHCAADLVVSDIDSNVSRCFKCDAGLYSFNGLKCESCPGNYGVCAVFGDNAGASITNEHIPSYLSIASGYQALPVHQPKHIFKCPHASEEVKRSDRFDVCLESTCNMTFNESLGDWLIHCKQDCADGYRDRLCSRCANGFFENAPFECDECNISNIRAYVILGTAAVLSAGLLLVYRRAARIALLLEFMVVLSLIVLLSAEWWTVLLIMVLGFVLLLLRDKVSAMSGLIKIFIYWAQTTAIIVDSGTWPSWISSFGKKLALLNLRASGVECFAENLHDASNRLLVYGLLPIFLILVIYMLSLGAVIVKRWLHVSQSHSRLGSEEPDTSEEVDTGADESDDALLLQSSLSTAETSIIVNFSDDDKGEVSLPTNTSIIENTGVYWSTANRNGFRGALFVLYASYFEICGLVLPALQICDVSGHLPRYPWIRCNVDDDEFLRTRVVGVVFFTIYVLGVPSFFALLLLRRRERSLIRNFDEDHAVGFLYEAYKQNYILYEIFWTARRLLVAIAFALLKGPVRRAMATLLLLIPLLLWMVNVRPFKNSRDNAFDVASSACLLYTYTIGNSGETDNDFVAILLLLLNSVICFAFLFAILSRSRILPHFCINRIFHIRKTKV